MTAPVLPPRSSSPRHWRLIVGAVLLALAGVVGTIGWYKLAGEPLLNRQVPYLASTLVAVLVLSVTGGALLVAEQMRTDDTRLDELEEAVRSLAVALAPQVERPARRADVARDADPGTDVGAVAPTRPVAEDALPERRPRRRPGTG